MAELDQSNPENLRKRDFYRAELIVLEAASDYCGDMPPGS